MYRLSFSRSGYAGSHFLVSTEDDLIRFANMEGVTIVENPYNPPSLMSEWPYSRLADKAVYMKGKTIDQDDFALMMALISQYN